MINHDVNLSSWVVNQIRFKCPMVVYYEAIKWPLQDHRHILHNKNHVLWSGVPKGRHDPGVKLTFIHHLLTLPDLSVDRDYRSRLYNIYGCPRISQASFPLHDSVQLRSFTWSVNFGLLTLSDLGATWVKGSPQVGNHLTQVAPKSDNSILNFF